MSVNLKTNPRCNDTSCRDPRCPQRRIHDAHKQGRAAMYAVLYVVESSVRTRTGALWSQSQILDPGVGLELTTTQPVADVRALSGKTLRAYLDGQQSMLNDYLRHPAAHAADSETAHHPHAEATS